LKGANCERVKLKQVVTEDFPAGKTCEGETDLAIRDRNTLSVTQAASDCKAEKADTLVGPAFVAEIALLTAAREASHAMTAASDVNDLRRRYEGVYDSSYLTR
jgi:hypothetical protein